MKLIKQYTPENNIIKAKCSQVIFLNEETKKSNPWKEKKKRNFSVASSYGDAFLKNKATRMNMCANVLQFKMTSSGRKLAYAWFCKVRLCPMCNWRRSLKIANENREIVLAANRQEKVRWLFLTLTTGETVYGKDLKNRIEYSMKAFNRLMKYKKVQQVVRGYFRGLEITKNKNRYHPHFHVLLAVKPSYFNNFYINKREWSSLWENALKTNSSVVIDIRTVKPNKKYEKLNSDKIQAFEGALQEVSKYPVKDIDLLKGNRQENAMTVYTIEQAISHKRLIGYGGILKKIRSELKLKNNDTLQENIIHIDETCGDLIAQEIEMITAYWHYGIQEYVTNKKTDSSE